MNNIKQIREQFDLITEKEEKEDRKLSALVRAGLYDSKKLPALKKALEKSADKMTSQEKRMLLNLLDSLISQVVSDDQVYRKVRQNVHNVSEAKMDTYSKFDPRYKAGWPTDKEMPSVLILKRKAIRVYPDNQKVALYYSQALDKYVTIPYNDIQMGLNEARTDDDRASPEDNVRINNILKKVPKFNPRYKNVSTILKGKIPPNTNTKSNTEAENKKFRNNASRFGGRVKGFMAAQGVKNHEDFKKFIRTRAVKKAVRARNAARAANKAALEENRLVGGVIGSVVKAVRGAGSWVSKSKGNKATKPPGKGLGRGGRGAGKGRLGLAGAAAGAAGGSGSGSNTPDSSSTVNHKFGNIQVVKSGPSKVDPNAVRNTRRQIASDQANDKMAKSQTNESNVLDTIKSIVEDNIPEQKIQFNENEITINNTVAKKLLNVYESVNKTNKKKMEQMLNENATSFNKVLTFAVRQ